MYYTYINYNIKSASCHFKRIKNNAALIYIYEAFLFLRHIFLKLAFTKRDINIFWLLLTTR